MGVKNITYTVESDRSETISPPNYTEGVNESGTLSFVSHLPDRTGLVLGLYADKNDSYITYNTLTAGETVSIKSFFPNQSLVGKYIAEPSRVNKIYIPIVVEFSKSPSITSIKQNNNGTYTISWSPAALSSGESNNIVYDLWNMNDGGILHSGIKGTSVTKTISSYNNNCTFMVAARLNSSDPYGYDVVYSAHSSKTFYPPSVSAPSLSASGTSGSSVTLSWTAATLNYATASNLQYNVYVGSSLYTTQSGLSVTIPESTLSGWGAGPHSFTVMATASGLSNTAAGTSLNSPKSNAVSFTYKPSTTHCSPPSVVTVSATNVAPNAEVQLSWEKASGGTNNAIAKYEVYRATSASGTYTKLKDVVSSSTSASTTVNAPTSNGASYYFKVRTIGSASGYESGQSTAYATLTCTVSNPTPPDWVTISGETSVYVPSDAMSELAWGGASPGTNNTIQGYIVNQNGAFYQETTDTKLNVPANPSVGGSHTYTVQTKGKHGNSGPSVGRTLYTYGLPTPPRVVAVTPSMVDAGTDAKLSWQEAKAGKYNDITGYHIHRAASAQGDYAYLMEVKTTQTSGECTVTAPQTMGDMYYYKIRTVGTHAQGDLSGSFASVRAKVYSECDVPAAFELGKTFSTGDPVRLSWSVASGGTNNPVVDYEVEYQDSADGSAYGQTWLPLGTTADIQLDVYPPDTPGHYRRYRIRARGAAGASYYSDWKISTNALFRDYTPCIAPQSVSLDETLSREDVRLSWRKASGGDGNHITGYDVESCDSENGLSWDIWSLLRSVESSAAEESVFVSPPAQAGSYRKFRVRTKGSAGERYYSDWMESSNTLRKDFTHCKPPESCTLSTSVSVAPVTLSWSVSEGGDGNPVAHYDVQRCESADGVLFGSWSAVPDSPVASASMLVSPPPIAGHVYKFRVRAVGSAGEAYASSWTESGNTLKTGHDALLPFTDAVLTANLTYVKAVHMTELQQNINLLLGWYGLPPSPFTQITDSQSGAGTYLKDWTKHIEELRVAIDRISKEHDPWISISVNVPRADVVMQLRDIVMKL